MLPAYASGNALKLQRATERAPSPAHPTAESSQCDLHPDSTTRTSPSARNASEPERPALGHTRRYRFRHRRETETTEAFAAGRLLPDERVGEWERYESEENRRLPPLPDRCTQ